MERQGRGISSISSPPFPCFPTCSISLYLLFPETQAGTRESLGVSRVSMWPLWTTLLLVLPLGGLGSPLCLGEPFYFLIAITKMLENKNDGSLYTPDNLLLSVIGFEEGPSVGIAVFHLQRLLDALGSRLWVTGQGPCPPCEGHPQRPVPLFLAKLLELLQGTCARELPSA
uniref:Uncharacterized protein n=1 Tax=Moschus moschiferus TaxID=68415 RepID=A0A8C6CLE1_MOSMO